ncbi:MAG: right-handed parallel beta-helix repeat-containing protein [Sedimentisphaerales bacterium]|nr:right-handed parallel beta-helix repeat-containing protein [Sedimentisphaerales bacterium]
MFSTRADILLASLVAAAILATAGRANEVSWVQGQACSSAWSIEPARPGDMDTISFSGPVRFYLTRCVAEQSLGGKPTLFVDYTDRTIELRFEPPPTDDCTEFWNPVCGLAGSFGPLEAGSWRLFSNVTGAMFEIEFTVGNNAGAPSVYHVDPGATGARNGSTWKDAFPSLQDALMAVGEGNEIRVARGTYLPDIGVDVERGDPNATFQLKAGMVVKGGYAGWRGINPNSRDVHAHETILSGDLFGDDQPVTRLVDMVTDRSRIENSRHVVTISGTDSSAVLDGFTITAGIAIDNELPDDASGGGGIYNDGGNATIRNCRIVGNGANYYGAGFYSSGRCTPVLIDCTLANNWTQWAGGAIYYHRGSDLIMSRCLVTGNGAEFQGGGVCGYGGGQLLISNSVLSGNRTGDSTWGRGGGLYGSAASVYVNQCSFVGNWAAAGSALACDLFITSGASEMHLSNCILWGDGTLVSAEGDAIVEIISSDIRGGWAGEGNIDVDPCFVQAGNWDTAGTAYDPCDDVWTDGDYHLKWASLCVDAGSIEAVWDPNGTDFGGQPRVSGVTVDLGAYELRNDPPVADAGLDVWGFTLVNDGKGAVTLDGSGSRDPEGLPLQFRWYYKDELVCDQARYSVELPVGVCDFNLVVDDPTGQTASDKATATVTLVTSTRTFVSPRRMLRNSSQDIIALTVLPKGKYPRDFDMAEPLRLFPGGIPAVRQSAFVWLSGDSLAQGAFRRADVMAAIPTNGPTEIRIVGRLKDGKYFSAADTVTIE